MKVKDKIKKNTFAKIEVKTSSIISHGSDKTKPQVEVKDVKPKAVRDTFDAYHIESGSLASQVIAYILDCNRKSKNITMKEIKAKFGNTFYSMFCRLEERKLAHREGKFLFVHEVNDKTAKLVLPIIKPRVGANDIIETEEKSKIDKLLSSK